MDRMNAPLHKKPDDTGARAALTAAQVTTKRQHQLWKAVAAVINMSKIEYEKKGAAGSEVKNKDYAKKVAGLLGLADQGDKFCHFLRTSVEHSEEDTDVTPLKSASSIIVLRLSQDTLLKIRTITSSLLSERS